MKTVIAFCANCSIMLDEDVEDVCLNCNHSLKERSDRCLGEFTEEDAAKLRKPAMNGYEE